MSRWDAISDRDYEDEGRPQGASVTRTCSRCGAEGHVPVNGPYVLQWTCDACFRALMRRAVGGVTHGRV